MSSQQLNTAAYGANYENAANLIVGRIASMIQVPRPYDIGVDFYCLPRVPSGPKTHTYVDLCSLQVKGGNAPGLTFGGLDKNGNWRQHEIAWLRSLVVPLYIARVDANCTAVDLYSTWHLWCIFWKTTEPFRIRCVTRPPSQYPFKVGEPSSCPDPYGTGCGDAKEWTVDLGPPFLHLTNELLGDATFNTNAAQTLRRWSRADRQTLLNLHLHIAVAKGIAEWTTNLFAPQLVYGIHTYWNTTRGRNVAQLATTLSPILANLGNNLHAQNDPAIAAVRPLLEWLEAIDTLDPIGVELLAKLRTTV